jgi:hypothetical protein
MLALAVAAIAALCILAWLTMRAVRRYVRRRWRRWLADAGGGLLAATLRSDAPSTFAAAFDPRAWSVARQRHRMWRAVRSANRTVAATHAVAGPSAQLARLAQDLQDTAVDVDRLLSVIQRSTWNPPRGDLSQARVLADTRRVVAAADELRSAALAVLHADSTPRVSTLLDDVRLESEAIRSGLASADRHMLRSER